MPPLPRRNPTNDPATDRRYYPTAGLDPDTVAEAAYRLYYTQGGCGHGSAQALINELGAALDAEVAPLNPWKLLPRALYTYGAGAGSWAGGPFAAPSTGPSQ